MGKLEGQSLALCKLGGIHPSENSISYSGGRGRPRGHCSLWLVGG